MASSFDQTKLWISRNVTYPRQYTVWRWGWEKYFTILMDDEWPFRRWWPAIDDSQTNQYSKYHYYIGRISLRYLGYPDMYQIVDIIVFLRLPSIPNDVTIHYIGAYNWMRQVLPFWMCPRYFLAKSSSSTQGEEVEKAVTMLDR